MTPYLAWVIFLGVFNLAAWTVNGGILKRFIS